MEKQYDKTNTFALSKADKGDNPKRPDYKGKVLLRYADLVPEADGLVTVYLDGWARVRQSDGERFLSGEAKPKVPQAPAAPQKAAAKPAKNLADDDNEIPF